MSPQESYKIVPQVVSPDGLTSTLPDTTPSLVKVGLMLELSLILMLAASWSWPVGKMLPLPNPHAQKDRSSEETIPALQEVHVPSDVAPVVELAFPASHARQVSDEVADGVEL